ncbi:MAG TPA: hypothetical protein PKO45_05395 [Rubrivivax sp.]|nr:hypothetical protein [Rubrivivax sp.]
MSGFESSNRDAAPAVDPLALTVYELDGSRSREDQRRVRSGRIKLLLVLLVCALPVIASYFTYYVVRPQGRTNYGTLIEPSRALPDVTLTALDGARVPLSSLRGQWLLLVVGAASCDAPCEARLYAQRQLREMLGRERERLDKVWLVTDDGMPGAALQQALRAEPAVTVLRYPEDELARWLAAEPGRALQEHLYLVDPVGQWMMRFPVDFDPSKVKRDIDRLLRASAAWDRPGR